MLLSITLITLCCAAISDAASDKRVKAVGVLTSIESDGMVVIDDSIYAVDSSARILDGQRKKTTLDTFTLPAKVQFEFRYTERTAIISVIQEIPQ
jgi:hypothetical protein